MIVTTLAALASPSLAQDGTVQGRVRDDEGSAVAGASVVLSVGERAIGAADTDRLGSFRISGVPAGQYTLGITGLGYASASLEISVAPGATVDTDLRVERRAIELEGLSVDAGRSRERIRFEEVGGVTVRELSLADLRRIPSVAEVDPVRAVEVLPGVVSTSDFSAGFHVRGGSQDQNLILLDGVPIFSPFHLGGLFSVLQSGGFPTSHGGRVSSVLEVESDAGDGDFGVEGGVSLLASRVAVSGGLPSGVADALGHANIHFRASARRSYFDWVLKPAFEFPYHLTDFQGIVEGWTHSGDRLTLSGYSGRDVLDLTRLDTEDFPLRIDWDWGNDLAGVRWTRALAGGGSLDVRTNFSRYGTGLSFPDFADTEFESRIQQAQVRADLDAHPTPEVGMGFGGSLDRLQYENRFASGGTEFANGRGSGVLLGAYAQTGWSRPREWLVDAGVRFDWWRPDIGGAVAEVSPRLSVKRFVRGGDFAVKLAVGRYTQFLHSLRDEELPIGLDVWVLAGSRAPHVVSDQLQIGVEGYRGHDWFWSIEGYGRSFDGVVAFNPADDPNDELDDILSGEGVSYGVDLLLRKQAGLVNGWLAVSFLKADRTFPDPLSPLLTPPDITYPPVFDKRLDVDLVLQFPGPWGWEGGLRWNAGTGTPYTRALGSYAYYSPRIVDDGGRLRWSGSDGVSGGVSDYAVVLEDRNASRYPTYHRLDLSFRRTFTKSWGVLTPYASLLNVYNRKNVLFYFFEYDRSPAARSGVSMFPVLPTFGLEVRF